MILISHRGNTHGPDPKKENRPSYILEALNKKYQVEIDVWWDNQWWLGHDKPEHKCPESFIFLTPYLWIHCKNSEAMAHLCINQINGIPGPIFFWHETDTYALTNRGILWTYPGKPLTEISICVLPEQANYTKKQLGRAFGICSDYVAKYKNM